MKSFKNFLIENKLDIYQVSSLLEQKLDSLEIPYDFTMFKAKYVYNIGFLKLRLYSYYKGDEIYYIFDNDLEEKSFTSIEDLIDSVEDQLRKKISNLDIKIIFEKYPEFIKYLDQKKHSHIKFLSRFS